MSSRLIGVWPAPDDMPGSEARFEACVELAKLCGHWDVLPIADPKYATFSDRYDVLIAAHHTGLHVTDLLDLAERIGFRPGWLFIAARVDVRRASEQPQGFATVNNPSTGQAALAQAGT